MSLSKDELAALVTRDIPAGSYVNLGIGLPTTVADHLEPEAGVVLRTENGLLGMGPAAVGDQLDPDLTNAGKVPISELPRASYFHHADSFAMMRGGHLAAPEEWVRLGDGSSSSTSATWPFGRSAPPEVRRAAAQRATSQQWISGP